MLLHSLNCLIIVMLIIHTCGDFLQQRLINEPNFPESVDAFFDTGSEEDLEDNFSNLRFIPLLQDARNMDKRSTDDRSMKLVKRDKIKSDNIINYSSDNRKNRARQVLEKKKRYSSKLSQKLRHDIHELNNLVKLISERENSKFSNKKLKKRKEVTYSTSMKPIFTPIPLHQKGKLAPGSKAGDIIIVNYNDDEDYIGDDKEIKVYPYQNMKRKITQIPKNQLTADAPLMSISIPKSSYNRQKTTTMVETNPEEYTPRTSHEIIKQTFTCSPKRKLKKQIDNSKTRVIWPETVKKVIVEAEQKINALRQRVKLLKRTIRHKKSNFRSVTSYSVRKRDMEAKKILEEAEKKIANLQNQKQLLIKASLYRKIRDTGSNFVYNPVLDKRKQELKQGIGDICAFEERLERHQEQFIQKLGSVETVVPCATETSQEVVEYYTPSYYFSPDNGYPIYTDVSSVECDPSTIVNNKDESNQCSTIYVDVNTNVPSDEDFLSEPPDYFTDTEVEKAFKQHECDSVITEKITESMLKFTEKSKRSKRNIIFPDLPVHHEVKEKIQKFPLKKNSNTKSGSLYSLPTHYKQRRSDVTSSTEVTIPSIKTVFQKSTKVEPEEETTSVKGKETEQMFPSTESEFTELIEAGGEPPSGTTNSIDDVTTQEKTIDADVMHESHPEERKENFKIPENTEGEQKKDNINLKATNHKSKKSSQFKTNSVHNRDVSQSQKVLAKIKGQLETYMETSTVKDYFADEMFTEDNKNYKPTTYISKIEEIDYAPTSEHVKISQSLKYKSLLNVKRRSPDDTQYEYDYGNFPVDSEENENETNSADYETDESETEKIPEEAKHLLSNLQHKVKDYKKQKEISKVTTNIDEENDIEIGDTTDEEEIEPMHYPDEESDKTHPEEEEPDTENLKDTKMTADQVLEDIENDLEEYNKQIEENTTEAEEIETTESVDRLIDEIQHELEEYQSNVTNPEQVTTEEPMTFAEEAEHKTETAKQVINEIQHELEDFEKHVQEYNEAKTDIPEPEETSEKIDNMEESEHTTEEIETTSDDTEHILGEIKHQLEELQTHINQETEENKNNTSVLQTEEATVATENTTNEAFNVLDNIELQLENYGTQHESTETPSTENPGPIPIPEVETEGPIEAEAENLLDNIKNEIKHFKQEYTTVELEPTTESIEKIIQTIKQEIQQYNEEKESQTQTTEEDQELNTSYQHLYTELGISNHGIKLSNECTLTQLRMKNHCICSVQQMLEDLMDDVKEINKSAHYEYTCRRFIRIEPGIIITNKSESKILRKRKTGDFTETFAWKRGARVGRDIESLLRKEINLPEKDNITYVIVGTKVTIPCYDKVEVSKNSNYTWTVHNGAPETTGDRSNNGSSIIIPSVSPEDSNNYTCNTYDGDSQKNSIYIHWLSVVSLPLYSLVVTVHLNASSKCQEGDLEILNLYYPVAIKDLLCSGSASMCSVTVEKPQCIRMGTEDIISLHVTLTVETLLTILPKLNQNDCSLQCQNRIYSVIVSMLLKNLASVTNLPVFFRFNYRTAELTPIQNNQGDQSNVVTNSINIVCPAGFGIYENPKICLACEPYTFNPGNEMHCQKCPRGTFQRAGGSRMCLPCSSFLDDPSCLFSAKVADFSRKYYLIPIVMMILILMLIGCCMMWQKRKTQKKAVLMMAKNSRDEEQRISTSHKSLNNSQNAIPKSTTEEVEIFHKQDSYFTVVDPKMNQTKSRNKTKRKTPPKPPPIDF